MSETNCPRCGAAAGAGDPHGLCPACLMRGAIELHTEPLACGRCGASLPPAAHFCAQCGSEIAPAGPTTETDPLRDALAGKLRGQYRIVRMLGRGGMGVVYLARDLTLEREVAIKVVKTAEDSPAMVERFRREARTAAKLSHPNIVPLHAFGEVDGMPYFVMGYVRGESLAEKLRRDGKLSEEEGRRVLAEIADALDHAHRQGIVHRDVKPDNVLLDDESGRALLTDFGVAKRSDGAAAATVAGIVGTPHYMSPEQAAGHSVDARSDIYSLGVLGFAALAGHLPFEGSTATEILSKHLTQTPPPLRSFAPSLAESTVSAVERCLAKDAAGRWPDARSLSAALGGPADAQLPDALQAVDGRGVLGLAAAIAWMIFVAFLVRGGAPPAIFGIHVAVIAFIYATALVNARREGVDVREAQRILWREPSWWLWWYPRRLRRPRNVWDRLPLSVRLLRSWPLFAVLLVAVLLVGDFPNVFRSPVAFGLKAGALAAWVISWTLLSKVAERALARAGLGQADRSRVMISIPPARIEFWSRPHIAPVLAAASRDKTPARAETTHDYFQMILRLGGELSGPLRPLGSQAAAAARQLMLAIGDDERRIEELARNLESGEEEKLREKIAALRISSGAEDELAPMRLLLEKQLELIEELAARVEAAKARRSRRVELLRTLALHLASLRAREPRPSSDPGALSDGVRALCEEIERHASTLSPLADAHADNAPTISRS